MRAVRIVSSKLWSKSRGLLSAIMLAMFLMFPSVSPAAVNVGYEGEIIVGQPSFVALDTEGRIYTSQKNGTITVINPDGKLNTIFGGKDDKWKNVLKGPRGIAFYKDRIYVADASLGKIIVLEKDGTFVDSFGSRGSKPKQFNNPMGIFIYKGVIYVADNGNDRIQILGQNGVYLGEIGTVGADAKDPARLNKPTDVIVDHRGLIYAVDSRDKVVKVYSPSGKYIKNLDLKDVEEPNALAMDSDGIVISDVKRYKICKVDFDYKTIVTFGTQGKGRAQFMSIDGIAVSPAGKVYVADNKQGVLQVFVPEHVGSTIPAEFVPPPTSVRFEGQFQGILSKLAWDGVDTLYGIQPKDKVILAVRDGKVIKTIALDKVEPESIAIDPAGQLWVLDAKKSRIIKLRKDFTVEFEFGSSGNREGYFRNPSDIAINSQGYVFVADPGNSRIQVFSPDGVFIKVIGRTDPKTGFVEDPIDITVDSADHLFVIDKKKVSVMEIGPEGALINEFGGKESGVFSSPISIGVTRDELFVLDEKEMMIKVFTKKGKHIRNFGSPGDPREPGIGEFSKPAGLAIKDHTSLLISDVGHERVQELYNVYTPARPSSLVAKGSTRSVLLNWDDNPESFVDHYEVYKASSATGPYAKISDVPTSSYIDRDVEPANKYFYQVIAVAQRGNESLKSSVADAIPEKYVAAVPKGITAKPQEWSVDLAWDKNGEEFLSHYLLYRKAGGKFEPVAETKDPFFKEGGLDSETEYTYAVSSVSTDGVESKMAEVVFTTTKATRPPIEVDIVNLKDIFSNSYKLYEKEGVGTIKVINNTLDKIARLKVSFTIKDFMDYPTEVEIRELAPRGFQEVDLRAVFNNKILNVTEDTPVQTEVQLSYYVNDHIKTFSNNYTINIYERHKMRWRHRERMVVFVTTKDPVVLEFTRGLVTQYSDTNDPVLYGSVLFDAMGMYGLTYVQDPSNSYQEISENVDTVDYLQYPRETLQLRAGDCDDLVILYASALESLGIKTKVVDIPGHMFMMFEIGKVADVGDDTMDGLFVVYEEGLWLPIEVTKVGSPFIEAWEVGSKQFYEWYGKSLGIMDVRSSWRQFKPANLPATEWRPEPILREDIEKKFNDEFKDLRKIRVKIRSKKYIATLQKNPKDVNAFLQLGIVYAEVGETGDALKAFDRALEIEPENAAVINNRANVKFLENKYDAALEGYLKATEIDASDPLVWVNLARVYLRLNRNDEARQAFARAYRIDASVSKKFRGMALKLLGPI